MERNELVSRLPYWDALQDTEKELVQSAAIVRSLSAGSLLHGNTDAGASCLGMFYVLSGEVRAYIVSDEGREITLFHIRAGESCVLSASCLISQISFETQLVIAKDAEILIIPSAAFGTLTEQNIYVRCFMLELATERFSAVMRVMESMIFKRFDQRLAHFLLGEYKKTGNCEIRMTQEQIAEQVNSAREVVARMLKQFVNDGLISVQRGKILLKDAVGLERIKG